MGWGSMEEAELFISGREYTTAGWISSSLEALEYAYNLGAIIEIADQGAVREFGPVLELLRNADAQGITTLNVALRLNVYEDAQLRVSRLESGSSFTVSFNGLGNVIRALAKVFDPVARAESREHLRHRQEMNRLDEEDKMTEVTRNRYNLLMEALCNPRSNFNNTAKSELGAEHHEALKTLLLREFSRAISVLEQNEVKVLSQPEPE